MKNYSTELKSCPFCGSERTQICLGIGLKWRAGCDDCGCRTKEFDSTLEAAAAWNRRADQLAVRDSDGMSGQAVRDSDGHMSGQAVRDSDGTLRRAREVIANMRRLNEQNMRDTSDSDTDTNDSDDGIRSVREVIAKMGLLNDQDGQEVPF